MNVDDGLTTTDDVGYWERMRPRWYSPSWDVACVAEELGVDVAAVKAHHELIGLPSWELGPGHPALQIDFDNDNLT